MKTFEHNIETGEVIERDLTAEELEQIEIDTQADLEIRQSIADKEAEKAALLERLGITAEEAKLLLA
jgi:hypothetical protein